MNILTFRLKLWIFILHEIQIPPHLGLCFYFTKLICLPHMPALLLMWLCETDTRQK